MRDELLNETLFMSIAHARKAGAAWADDYNTERPHSSLVYATPAAYAVGLRLAASQPVATVAEDGDNNSESLAANGGKLGVRSPLPSTRRIVSDTSRYSPPCFCTIPGTPAEYDSSQDDSCIVILTTS